MPQQHKRNLPSAGAGVGSSVPPPPKKTKQQEEEEELRLASEMPSPTTLEDAIKIIDMYKAEQALLTSHISKTDPNILRAPATIKALLQQGQDLSVFADAITKNMRVAHSKLESSMESCGYKRGAVTSDDFSQAMCPFIDEIERLVDGNAGDELKRLQVGYDLLFKLKSYSQADLNEYVSYGDRDSDEPADELLSEIIKRRNDAGDIWDWKKDLEDLKSEAKNNAAYGVEPWFPDSIEALSALAG